jgi:hypothetical protein
MGRIYEEVTGTRKDIGTLDGKVDQALKQTADHEARMRTLETQAAQSADHETRIKGLEDTVAPIADHRTRLPAVERKVWLASGAVGIVVGGATVAATLLAGTGR